MNNEAIVAAVLGVEQGYVNNPADKGGPTNFGITMPTLAKHRGQAVTIDDIQALTKAEATQIYIDDYIVAPGFDRIINEPLRWAVVDAAVDHGQPTAAMWLQSIAKTTVDGIFGPRAAAAVNLMPPRQVLAKFVARRGRAYGTEITYSFKKGTGDAQFAGGWLDRLGTFIELLGEQP